MSFCPSDERLLDLLADAVSASERDSLAGHVERCASCQEKLARLARTSETRAWRRAGQPARGTEAEEGMVRRLKRVRPSSAAHCPRPADGTAGDSARADSTRGTGDFELPAVPGFEILGELGRGGMGVVYRARQVSLQRTVALKMVRSGAHVGPRGLARFRAEAGVIARLQH